MKNILKILFFCTALPAFTCLCATQPVHHTTIPSLIQNEYKLHPDDFTTLVFRRYYFINRFNHLVQTLLTLTKNMHLLKEQSPVIPDAPRPFSLKSLSVVWQDFIAYKDLHNDLLLQDLAQEIITVSDSFLPHYHAQKKLSLSSEESTNILPPLADEALSPVEINEILSRFYLLKRLETALTYAHFFQENNLLHFPFASTITAQELPYQEEPMIAMINALYTEQSFDPFFKLWSNLKRYKYIHHKNICHEFTHFIIHLITLSEAYLDKKMPVKIFPTHNLNTMAIEDILNILDVLVDELPAFIEKHELNGTASWEIWLKKHWHVTSLGVAVLAIRLYMTYHRISPSPKPEWNRQIPA